MHLQVWLAGAVVRSVPVREHYSWVLCSRTLPQGETMLKGRKVTCFHSIKDDVTNAGGSYVDQEVVIDGNLITSRKPDDLPAFVAALITAIKSD
jgi:protease I